MQQSTINTVNREERELFVTLTKEGFFAASSPEAQKLSESTRIRFEAIYRQQ